MTPDPSGDAVRPALRNSLPVAAVDNPFIHAHRAIVARHDTPASVNSSA